MTRIPGLQVQVLLCAPFFPANFSLRFHSVALPHALYCNRAGFHYYEPGTPVMKNTLILFLFAILAASNALAADENAFYKLGPDSLPQEGVPQGKLLGPMHLPSRVFTNYSHTYWIYVPAQYDPKQPAGLMVFQD